MSVTCPPLCKQSCRMNTFWDNEGWFFHTRKNNIFAFLITGTNFHRDAVPVTCYVQAQNVNEFRCIVFDKLKVGTFHTPSITFSLRKIFPLKILEMVAVWCANLVQNFNGFRCILFEILTVKVFNAHGRTQHGVSVGVGRRWWWRTPLVSAAWRPYFRCVATTF